MSGPVLAERFQVEDRTQVAPARSGVRELARSIALPDDVVDRIALATTELAQNLHLYAVGGEIVAYTSPGPTAYTADDAPTLTVIALDRGPGVAAFQRCLEDGYSTGGTMGAGLGTVRRAAAFFDAVSEPRRGTAVLARFRADPEGDEPPVDVGAFGTPLTPGEPNGDSFAAVHRGNRLVLLTADGLGHGPVAAEASHVAASALPELAHLAPADLLAQVNHRMVQTRGAAVSAADIELEALRDGGQLRSAGMGNVSIVVVSPDGTSRRVATSHGTAGARIRSTSSEQRTPFPAGGLLIMHSDGLQTRWDVAGRAGLLRHCSALVSAVLWRDHERGRDDSLIVVAKANPRWRAG